MDSGKVGFNLAIPINTFLSLAPQGGVDMGLRAENSPAAELTAAYAPPAQPDQRDMIQDINSVLNKVNSVWNIIRNFPNSFNF